MQGLYCRNRHNQLRGSQAKKSVITAYASRTTPSKALWPNRKRGMLIAFVKSLYVEPVGAFTAVKPYVKNGKLPVIPSHF